MFGQDDPKYQPSDPPPTPDEGRGIIISSDTHREKRIPPGQSRTRKWPVLHYGSVPSVDLTMWRLEIDGLVERPLQFTWEEYQSLPRVKVFSDFHCVTRWSRLDNVWEGVSTAEIIQRARQRTHPSP